MKSRRIQQILWPAFTAVAVGMTLVFMLLSSSHFPRRAVEGGIGIGLVLVCASLWHRTSCREKKSASEIIVDQATVVVDARGSAEIILGPQKPITNPTLYLATRGRPITVEDAWHEEVSVLSSPRLTTYWNRGVVYPGVLDSRRVLRVLLRNEGRTPALVWARVTTHISKE